MEYNLEFEIGDRVEVYALGDDEFSDFTGKVLKVYPDKLLVENRLGDTFKVEQSQCEHS